MRKLVYWWAVVVGMVSATANAEEADTGSNDAVASQEERSSNVPATPGDAAPGPTPGVSAQSTVRDEEAAPAQATSTGVPAPQKPIQADETPPRASPPPSAATAPGRVSKSENVADRNASRGEYRIVPFVMVGYTPEMGVVFGGAAVGVLRRPKDSGLRDSQLMLAAAVSSKSQLTLQLRPDIYLFDDGMHLGAILSASRFPNVFYGIGSHTRKQDGEDYTPVIYEVELSPKLRLLRGMYFGPSARVTSTKMVKIEDEGFLDNAAVVGSSGGQTVTLGFAGFYDTRSSTVYPRAGHIVSMTGRLAMPRLGSDFNYREFILDARKYISLPWGNRHVLALQTLAEVRGGAPPFYELGQMGGPERMRGYFKGRFRDRNYLEAQLEYRLPLFWRFGAVGFMSAGQVSRSLRDVPDSPVRFAAGGGLRFAPLKDVPVNIRLDVAYGNEPLVYLNIGEAF